MRHVTIPQEIVPIANIILNDLGVRRDTRIWSQTELLAAHPFVPDYATALDELDEWHCINLWSIAPAVIISATHDTSALVSSIEKDEDTRRFIVDWLCETMVDEDVAAAMRSTLEDGPTDAYMERMNLLKETFRLDGAFAQGEVG